MTPNNPWPEIISFDELDLPEFPTYALPKTLREWVEAESHATQTPADLAGLLALAVCSATIARRVEVEPRTDYREPVNLFVTVLLGPGNRKSAVFSDAIKPLRELESELIKNARPAVAREESRRRRDESRLKKLEKRAEESDDTNFRDEADKLAEKLAEQGKPVLPRLIVDDITCEKLAMMLDQQDGRLASMSPEGGVFDLMAGRYSKSGAPQFVEYLKAHSGDDLVTDRVIREPVRVEKPALTCAYAIQPEVIRGVAENPAFRARGLLGRFLYAYPVSWIGQRTIATAPVSPTVRAAYQEMVRTLAVSSEDCESAPCILKFTLSASEEFESWEAQIEDMLADGGQMEMIRDWGGKLAGATSRLAGVLHCVENGLTGRIDKVTIEAAVDIARYLNSHAEAVLNMMAAKEGSRDDDAHYVQRWFERHGQREFTKRDAHQHGKHRFPKADDIDPALEELTRRNYIRLKPSETNGPGRPPSPSFEVNPAVFAIENPQKRSQYPQNAVNGSQETISENNESALAQSENTNRVQVTI